MEKKIITTFFIAVFLVSCTSRNGIRQQKGGAASKQKTEAVDSAKTKAAKKDSVTEKTQATSEQKAEEKKRVGDVYTCDYEWDGTHEWFGKMQRKDEARCKLLQGKISAKASSDSLKEALDYEVKCWKDVAKAFDKMVIEQADLAFTSGGGSVEMEMANWASVLLRCYRHACLKQDLRSICDSTKSKKITVRTSKLFAYLDKRLNAMNEIDTDENFMNGGEIYDKRKLAACKKNVKRVKTALKAWVEARDSVSVILDVNSSNSYQHHTQRMLNSLSEGF